MRSFLAVLLLILLGSTIAAGQLYEWTDDQGSVSFTDDPERIPAKYRNRAKPREGMMKESPELKGAEGGKPAAKPEATTAGPKLYNGRVLSWWQSAYDSRVRQLEALKGELTRLQEEENNARRKRVIYGRLSDRKLREEKKGEIAIKEAEVKSAERDLAEFKAYAERSGLSLDMLESGSR